MCNSGEVEDEYHFLFECRTYSSTRKGFLDKLGLIPNRQHLGDDFKAVFQRPYELGKFLKCLMNERKGYVNSSVISPSGLGVV